MLASNDPRQNRILATVPATVYQRLLPHLKLVTLPLDQALFPRRGELRYVYFPTTSIVTSAYAIETGVSAQAWLVGNEGVVGISSFLGRSIRSNQAEVQIAGHAFQLAAHALKSEFGRGGAFQKILLRYVMALITQASQLGVCSHHHVLDERLCQFLLFGFDRMGTTELTLTQQRIARILGVRREGVTDAAGRLRAARVIHYNRGHVTLLNRQKLKARACACYMVIKNEFDRAESNDLGKPTLP